jgi:hypothetical protein
VLARDPICAFIQKPFLPDQFRKKLHDLLLVCAAH